MTVSKGTLVDREELVRVLLENGCDADDDGDGRFLVTEPLISLLGTGQEFLIVEKDQCRIKGEWVSILDLLLKAGRHPFTVIA